jgi:hypothetical protein
LSASISSPSTAEGPAVGHDEQAVLGALASTSSRTGTSRSVLSRRRLRGSAAGARRPVFSTGRTTRQLGAISAPRAS